MIECLVRASIVGQPALLATGAHEHRVVAHEATKDIVVNVFEEVGNVGGEAFALHHEHDQVDGVVEHGESVLEGLDHARLVAVRIAEADRVDEHELVVAEYGGVRGAAVCRVARLKRMRLDVIERGQLIVQAVANCRLAGTGVADEDNAALVLGGERCFDEQLTRIDHHFAHEVLVLNVCQVELLRHLVDERNQSATRFNPSIVWRQRAFAELRRLAALARPVVVVVAGGRQVDAEDAFALDNGEQLLIVLIVIDRRGADFFLFIVAYKGHIWTNCLGGACTFEDLLVEEANVGEQRVADNVASLEDDEHEVDLVADGGERLLQQSECEVLIDPAVADAVRVDHDQLIAVHERAAVHLRGALSRRERMRHVERWCVLSTARRQQTVADELFGRVVRPDEQDSARFLRCSRLCYL